MVALAAAVLALATSGCPPRPPDTATPITRSRWLSGATVTEYYPVREAWFGGPLVRVPGLAGRHSWSWLFGSHGVAMNGEGLARDGSYVHFAGPYDLSWVNGAGAPTSGCWTGHWTNGEPSHLGGWRSAQFAPGRSSLPFWHAVAVDPHLVPYGSRVFIPAYCGTPAHGWFRALDTGGAIIGAHFDVYRAPPRTLVLHALRRQKVYVVPPGHAASNAVRCSSASQTVP